jgi:hypothetical protein
MKITFKTYKLIYSTIITLFILLSTSSCGKVSESASGTVGSITEADAAELTTDAIDPATGGMINQINNTIDIYNKSALSCGVEKDSGILLASATGISPSYSYNFVTNALIACNGTTPFQLIFNFTGAGSFNTSRMSATDNCNAGFVITGLGATASQYFLSSIYNRSGATTSKIKRQYTFTSNLTIKSTDLSINKTTQEIASGTAAVNLTATSTSGHTFTFNGTITFLGNKKATLILNSGTSYIIQWV